MANIVYEKLKEVAETNSLTDAQIENATKTQAAVYMDIDASHIDDAAFDVAKAKLLRVRYRQKWQAIMENAKDLLIAAGFKDTFPDAEFAVDSRRKTATIFFEGKLSEDEL